MRLSGSSFVDFNIYRSSASGLPSYTSITVSSARSERSSEKPEPRVSVSTASATKRRASTEKGTSSKRRSYSCAVSTSPRSHSTVRLPPRSVTENGIIMSRPSSRGSCSVSFIITHLPPVRHLRARNFMHIYFILIAAPCQERKASDIGTAVRFIRRREIAPKAPRCIDKYTIIMYNIKLRYSARTIGG